MTNKDIRIFFYLIIIIISNPIYSFESSLHCWRCEVTIQSSDPIGIFLDDCRGQFDFTQHTRENCDGKCWKSVDLLDRKRFDNNTYNQSFALLTSTLKSSRRCFSANELIRAAEMGVNTSDGCRQVKRENRKMKEICFCSDQDMCNHTWKLTHHLFFLLTLSLLNSCLF